MPLSLPFSTLAAFLADWAIEQLVLLLLMVVQHENIQQAFICSLC